MPPALTRAASTGVDAYALFRAIDIDDSSAVPVEELLLCGSFVRLLEDARLDFGVRREEGGGARDGGRVH